MAHYRKTWHPPKTGGAQRITTLQEEDRAADDKREKFGEARMCSFRDMRADKQTDRQTDTQTRSSQYSESIPEQSNNS